MASVLHIKERIEKNLPGSRLAAILDHFLYSALAEVAKTTIMKEALVDVLMYSAYHTRRKISSLSKEDTSTKLVYAFFSDDPVSILRTMNLDRRIVFEIVERYLHVCEQYHSALQEHSKHKVRASIIKRIIAYRGPYTLTTSYSIAKRHLLNAYSFRTMIAEKFVRYAHNKAAALSKSTNLTVDADDLRSNMIVSLINAINRYDANRGALPTHIAMWLKDSTFRPQNGHELGIAFNIPSGQRKILLATNPHKVHNIAENIDDYQEQLVDESPYAEEQLLQAAEMDSLVAVCMEADTKGIALLLLDVPVKLSKEQIQQQE